MTIVYQVGTREAIEAEFGIDVQHAAAIVQFVDDEVYQWFPCENVEAAKVEVEEMTDGKVFYL